MEAIERIEKNGKIGEIFHDDNPESPRQWDNLGKMVCFHGRYNLGDQHDFNDPEEFQEWVEKNINDLIIHELYLYDHSGITMSIKPFSCSWDSGMVGIIYVEKEKVKKEYGWKRISKKRDDKIKERLKCEVEVYNQYLTGDVYGYIVTDENGDEVDSCWGFYGIESVTEEVNSILS